MTGENGRTPTRARRWAARLGAASAVCAATVTLGLGTASAQPTAQPAAVPAPATTPGTPCAATVKACMDLSSRQAWLTDGAGHVVAGPFAAAQDAAGMEKASRAALSSFSDAGSRSVRG